MVEAKSSKERPNFVARGIKSEGTAVLNSMSETGAILVKRLEPIVPQSAQALFGDMRRHEADIDIIEVVQGSTCILVLFPFFRVRQATCFSTALC